MENAGLVTSERRGKFVFYKLNADSLAGHLSGFMVEYCPFYINGQELLNPRKPLRAAAMVVEKRSCTGVQRASQTASATRSRFASVQAKKKPT